MYVPPLDALLQSVGKNRADFVEGREISLPVGLVKLLLQMALAYCDFNEGGYLAANPDIAAAKEAGELESARLHYIGFGYFEGRAGATPAVDEKWYLQTYPDVAEAIRAGLVASAEEHFRSAGAAEGRSPSARYEIAAKQWKKALSRS
jgi:hypothetical protein